MEFPTTNYVISYRFLCRFSLASFPLTLSPPLSSLLLSCFSPFIPSVPHYLSSLVLQIKLMALSMLGSHSSTSYIPCSVTFFTKLRTFLFFPSLLRLSSFLSFFLLFLISFSLNNVYVCLSGYIHTSAGTYGGQRH